MTFFPKEESLKMSNCVMYVVFTCFGNTSDKEDAMKYQLTDLIAIEFLQKSWWICATNLPVWLPVSLMPTEFR